MVRELDELDIKLMVSVWPTVNPISENYETMVERDLLIRTERGAPAFLQFQDKQPAGPIDLRFYDATNPEARQFIWDKVRENYSAHGAQTFWLDACEPEMEPMHPDNLRFYLGNGLVVANAYPLLHEQGFYEHMQQAGQSAILNLCRSAWIGSQRYGAAIWSGDITSTFEALQVQVRAGLNMAMSGIPWWTTDIGGFYGADIESQTFHELIIRWFQYAAFCPIFRLHGYRDVSGDAGAMLATGGPNEAWSFGDEAYEIIKEQLFLRERLRPYLMEQMRFAQETGIPPMRPLFFDFPADQGCSGVDDQFLLGPDLLVAPVLTEGTRQRSVYLPAGTTWTEAWGGQVFEGGQSIVVDAPLTRIPVYLRADAQVPIA
jgi:alpha-D-xyloside xylohydrolase